MADQPLTDRFREWMSERRLPLTPQRTAIAELLLTSGRQLSAADIVRRLAATDIRVGAATVYRTLDVLLESGLVEETDRGEGFRRFVARRELPHHEQLLCTGCGRVESFRDAALERTTHRVADAHGFERERHRVVIYGKCDACRRAGPPAGARP